MAKRVIQVGTGGFGALWCRTFLPSCVEAGLIEVVAAVDRDPAALVHAQERLGLPAARCYTDVARAMADHQADFCTVVVPPAFHEEVVDAALAAGLDILSEKPIADSLAAAIRISEKVRAAGRRMGITMSHRFAQDKTTLRTLLGSGAVGDLDYLVGRFTASCRAFGSWGDFRHRMADPMLIEGSVHHLDILADLAGADCTSVYARSWTPRWAEYAGDPQVMVTMDFANGVHAFYEGAHANASTLNGWGAEYVRAECEGATVIMSGGQLVRIDAGDPERRPIAPVERVRFGHPWLIEQFVAWLDGGPPMETNVDANLRSLAIVFAAVESSRTGQPVDPRRLLATAAAAEGVAV